MNMLRIPHMAQKPRRTRLYPLYLLLGCILLCVLAGCTNPPTEVPPTVMKTPPATFSTPTAPAFAPSPTSTLLPTPNTSCPANDTGRAAVLPPLILGTHQNLVYLSDTSAIDTQAPNNVATLKRYDITTGAKTVIASFPNAHLVNPQVSADGQWLLFVSATKEGPEKLQLLRIDGQDLQTLYCTSDAAINYAQWSTDQRHIVFLSSSITINSENIRLLDLQTGNVQTEFVFGGASFYYAPFTWLNTTRVLLQTHNADGPFISFSLLDTSKGPNQEEQNLQQLQPGDLSCGSLDSSYDASSLFISTCYDSGLGQPHKLQGPGSIITEPVIGGASKEKIIYSDEAIAITAVRAISAKTLLFTVGNLTGDTTHNGLWKINTDGTGLVRLTTDTPQRPRFFNPSTQYPWSNISRDGQIYALYSPGYTQQPSVGLTLGLLSGGSMTVLTDTPWLTPVGWTTMS
jgi:dipeptidyl aminopeptidase/acylaminoacyl peptidase